MKYLITTFILAILVCLTAAAAKPRPKPWTFEYRSGWNQACYDALMQVVARQGVQGDPLKIKNLCDCSSDLIQQKYSQEEVIAFGDNPPKEFIKFTQGTVDTCMSDPI